jgi:hypothetical protein
LRKQLVCPACGDIVADALHQPWRGRLVITSLEGYQIMPLSGSLLLRMAEQDIASPTPRDLEGSKARRDWIHANIAELIYELTCRRGHSTLRTSPQIAHAIRHTPGRWVRLE